MPDLYTKAKGVSMVLPMLPFNDRTIFVKCVLEHPPELIWVENAGERKMRQSLTAKFEMCLYIGCRPWRIPIGRVI